ncbi:outer membrane protein TolC [Deinococcus metalli]|uniref:Outer membrane protein TolC n=1 Tax=Deinococcus metalli TaxID=1141878 RepID=A0A7W8NPH3_9DEIO|nr:TolC family protein [Deinococcus metalli]MBB5375755.1 outer membrane protein TolC [Deinococcus metalli]GHF37300.1 transporter [Deinococcus metalli]
MIRTLTRPTLLLLLATATGAAAQTTPAQATPLTLAGAVTRALASGADITTARANLQKAQAALRAARTDPTSPITTLTQAEQDAAAQAATLEATKFSVTQTVVTQYTAAYETAQRIALSTAQVALDDRQLKIAQARLAARVATALDVSRAQTTLNTDRQDLADAQAQQPVLEAQLARSLNLPAGTDLTLSAPPAPPKLSVTLAALQGGLATRLPTLVQAANGAAFAALQVKLADNDYTPARTLEDARTALANAQRSADDAGRATLTQLRDAYRAVQDAQQRVGIAAESRANAQTSLTNAQAKLRAGTAAAVDVQAAQVQAQQAALGVTQAQDGVWKALAALSAASGTDVTGLVK